MYMSERCGAWQVGSDPAAGSIAFTLFFPAGAETHIQSIRVGGTFQSAVGGTNWQFQTGPELIRQPADPRGTFWSVTTAAIPAGFYEYKYLVQFDNGEQRIVTDPCARYGGFDDQNSAVVVGGSSPADNLVRPLVGGRKPLADLVMYELMIDDFTAEYRAGSAPLKAVADRLDHLVALGVNAILFMPWTAWPHSEFDWGYEPFQYFAVAARYADHTGAPQEKLSWLKRLVSLCHDRGIHVVMDGVYNHASQQFPYPQFYRNQAECPFTAASFGGTFDGLQDLDFNEECTNEFILDVCLYWIQTFGIDGIRFDNTVNFYVPSTTTQGLPRLLTGLERWLLTHSEDNFSLTLEHINVDAAAVTNSTAATSFWDNSLYENAVEGLRRGQLDARLLNSLNTRQYLSAGKVPTSYLSNHDHSQIGWVAGERDLAQGITGSWWTLQPYIIALFTGTAVPLIPNGQEFGSDHYLPEQDHRTGRRVVGRPVVWKMRTDVIGTALFALHARLSRLRTEHPAMRSELMYPASWPAWQASFNTAGVGIDSSGQLAIFHRWADLGNAVENLVVVLNFSESSQKPQVPFPLEGTWTDLLAGFDDSGVAYSVDVAGPQAQVEVGSHWGRILHKVTPH